MVETAAVDGAPRTEALASLFETLRSENPDIIGTALLSQDGLLLGAALPPDLEEGLAQGIAAMLASVAERTAIELTMGPMEHAIVRGPMGYTILWAAPGQTILLLLTNVEARLGLAMLDARRAVLKLEKLL